MDSEKQAEPKVKKVLTEKQRIARVANMEKARAARQKKAADKANQALLLSKQTRKKATKLVQPASSEDACSLSESKADSEEAASELSESEESDDSESQSESEDDCEFILTKKKVAKRADLLAEQKGLFATSKKATERAGLLPKKSRIHEEQTGIFAQQTGIFAELERVKAELAAMKMRKKKSSVVVNFHQPEARHTQSAAARKDLLDI
ncbi:MAG: hypothetical protein P4M14_05605 [Gammaproteobacteria bacterium]|nr:hypothetical protein [Gammaproteobacteria bacterium]